MESKTKYLSELSDLASPYFKKNFQSYKLLQPAQTKFKSSQLSDIFPESNDKFIARVKTPKKFRVRPTTAIANSLAIANIENITKQKKISHSEKYSIIQKYLQNLKFLDRISDELTLNFINVSSNEAVYEDDGVIPSISFINLDKNTLISECKKLTDELRVHLTADSQGRSLETLWRGLIKIIDYSFSLTESVCVSIKKEAEELAEFRVEQIQSQYENLSQASSFKIGSLNEEIEKLKGRILELEQDLSFKSRIITEREKKLEEMNNFENKEYTIFKLGRMIKGLHDFIEEAEKEHDFQEKTLEGISSIFEIGEKLTRPPESSEKECQTSCSVNNFGFRFREYENPVLFCSIIPGFLETAEDKKFDRDDIFEYCYDVLKEDHLLTFTHSFILKGLEKGYSKRDFFGILSHLKKLETNWSKIFKKLLGIDGTYIGNFCKFIKMLDSSLPPSQNSRFVDLETVYSFLFKVFSETCKIHRVFNSIHIYEYNNEKKCFVLTSLKKVELNLLKIVVEVKKQNLRLPKLLNDPASPGLVSKSFFLAFVSSLPLQLSQNEVLDLWEYVTGSYMLEEIKSKFLIANMKIQYFQDSIKHQFANRFDIMNNCIQEWEMLQEDFFSVYKSTQESWKSSKDVINSFKSHKISIDRPTAIEIFTSKFSSLNDLTLQSLSLIDFFPKKKHLKHKEAFK